MSSSEIIAIVAIVAGLSGTIVTLIVNYYTNKDNNKSRLLENEANIVAKRREAVFAERLKALSDITSKLAELKLAIRDMIIALDKGDEYVVDMLDQRLGEKYTDFVEIYHNKRMYIPKEIDVAMVTYADQCRNFIPLNHDPVKANQWHDSTRDTEAKIITAIQQLSSFQ
jgi:hypothetical protein